MTYDIDDPGKESWVTLPNHYWDDDDLIDFPCSDTFLRHYHALGLTPRCPEPDVRPQLNELSGRLERIESAIRSRPRPVVRPVYQQTPMTVPVEYKREVAPRDKKTTKGVG